MKTAIKRKNYYLDELKIKKVQESLGTKTETETLNKAMDLIMFRTDLLESFFSPTITSLSDSSPIIDYSDLKYCKIH